MYFLSMLVVYTYIAERQEYQYKPGTEDTVNKKAVPLERGPSQKHR